MDCRSSLLRNSISIQQPIIPIIPISQPSSGQHQCPFCGRAFSRPDSAKRHTTTCPSKGNQPSPPHAKRGRRLRACDNCSRVKVSCNSKAKAPCGRCSSRNLVCTYQRIIYQDPRPGSADCPSRRRRTPPRPGVAGVAIGVVCTSMSFLLNVTDPYHDSYALAVISEEPEKKLEGSNIWSALELSHDASKVNDVDQLFYGFMGSGSHSMDMDMESPWESRIFDDYDENILEILSLVSPQDVIGTQLSILVTDLQQLASLQPKLKDYTDRKWLSIFFTSANFQIFLKALIHRRYYQYPLIHWPTFNPEKTSLHLLLALMLTGASYLPYREGPFDSQCSIALLYEISEKYIFQRLKSFIRDSDVCDISHEGIELCQAALLVIGLGCGKNDGSAERIITKRLPKLVTILRKLNFMGRKHDFTSSSLEWQSFVDRESCIRIVTWTFFMDTLTTLFYNKPPIMMVSEVSGHLPCSESVWDSTTGHDFLEQAGHENSRPDFPCLKDLISGLLDAEWPKNKDLSYRKLTVNHLHVLICG